MASKKTNDGRRGWDPLIFQGRLIIAPLLILVFVLGIPLAFFHGNDYSEQSSRNSSVRLANSEQLALLNQAESLVVSFHSDLVFYAQRSLYSREEGKNQEVFEGIRRLEGQLNHSHDGRLIAWNEDIHSTYSRLYSDYLFHANQVIESDIDQLPINLRRANENFEALNSFFLETSKGFHKAVNQSALATEEAFVRGVGLFHLTAIGLVLVIFTLYYSARRGVAELKKIEHTLEGPRKELEIFFDTANAPIFGLDIDGKVNAWNQQCEKLSGYKKEEVLGLGLNSVPFEVVSSKSELGETFSRGLQGQEASNIEVELKSRAGKIKQIRLSTTTKRDTSGQIIGVAGFGQDITELNMLLVQQDEERKEASAQIIQASKLATLGEMATSVAHELNQPLNIIRMAAWNSRRKLAQGDSDAQVANFEYLDAKLERIEGQISRASQIIDHMRMFGREAREDLEPIDPTKAVTNALDLMGEQLRLADIKVSTSLPAGGAMVMGHSIQLEQVILNLLTNARDAIGQRLGVVKGAIELCAIASGSEVTITCADNGGGIPDGIISRIFEPFYTTKEVGQGTGLGLSVTYGIIRDMNGAISAENTDKGACFTIKLPRLKQ